jgi:hypothetical protein
MNREREGEVERKGVFNTMQGFILCPFQKCYHNFEKRDSDSMFNFSYDYEFLHKIIIIIFFTQNRLLFCA